MGRRLSLTPAAQPQRSRIRRQAQRQRLEQLLKVEQAEEAGSDIQELLCWLAMVSRCLVLLAA